MNTRVRNGLMVAGVLALPMALTTAAQGQEAADIVIRGTNSTVTPAAGDGGDITEDRSRGNGSWEFLREGIAMEAPSADENPDGSYDQAGVYWTYNGTGLPDSAALDWLGTRNPASSENATASVVIRFDADDETGNGNDTNFLLMEDIYGGDLLWLSGSSSDDAKEASPRAGSTGSQWDGTLPEWQEALPDATVTRVGVSLGGGIEGEGLLRSVTLGDDTYTFTSDEEVVPDPEPTERDVNGNVSAERAGNSLDITLSSQAQPANTVEDDKLRWRVAVVGEGSVSFVQGFDEVDSWSRTFRARTGAYTVRVFKNGEQVREYVIRTGR